MNSKGPGVQGGGEIPARGDLVWISLDPQAGHAQAERWSAVEQAGRRLAVVLSPERYNAIVGLALFCPVTDLVKGYPWEVAVPDGMAVSGVVLSDRVVSLDWRTRRVEKVAQLPPGTVAEILGKLGTLLAV